MTIAQMLRAQHVGIKDLKNRLSMLFKTHKPIVATDRGRPIYLLIPYDEMVELLEMLEEAKDEEFVRMVQSGRKEYVKGKWRSARKLWKKLGI